MNKSSRSLGFVIGLSAFGGGITGLVAFVAGLYMLFSGRLDAAGLSMIAAALSFGLIANAVLRE